MEETDVVLADTMHHPGHVCKTSNPDLEMANRETASIEYYGASDGPTFVESGHLALKREVGPVATAAATTMFKLPSEPTESLDKSRQYPPIVTADGRVDTDIDHLMEHPEEQLDDIPMQAIPSPFPKPKVIRIIDGSLDDDIDNLMNHDGTMAHTLVDHPTFRQSDLKEINAKKSGKKHNSRGQTNRSFNKTDHEEEYSDEEDSSQPSTSMEVVPYLGRNNSANGNPDKGDDFSHREDRELKKARASSPSDRNSLYPRDIVSTPDNICNPERQTNMPNKPLDPRRKQIARTETSGAKSEPLRREHENSIKFEPASFQDCKSGGCGGDRLRCDKDNRKSTPHEKQSLKKVPKINSEDVSQMLQRILAQVFTQEVDCRPLEEKESAKTIRVDEAVQNSPDFSSREKVEPSKPVEDTMDNSAPQSESDPTLTDPRSECGSVTSETPNNASTGLSTMQDTINLLTNALDCIADSGDDKHHAKFQKLIAVTALKVAGDSMAAAAKMADTLTTLMKTTHSGSVSNSASQMNSAMQGLLTSEPKNITVTLSSKQVPREVISSSDPNVCYGKEELGELEINNYLSPSSKEKCGGYDDCKKLISEVDAVSEIEEVDNVEHTETEYKSAVVEDEDGQCHKTSDDRRTKNMCEKCIRCERLLQCPEESCDEKPPSLKHSKKRLKGLKDERRTHFLANNYENFCEKYDYISAEYHRESTKNSSIIAGKEGKMLDPDNQRRGLVTEKQRKELCTQSQRRVFGPDSQSKGLDPEIQRKVVNPDSQVKSKKKNYAVEGIESRTKEGLEGCERVKGRAASKFQMNSERGNARNRERSNQGQLEDVKSALASEENERNCERSNHRQMEGERNALAYGEDVRNRARLNHRQMENVKNALAHEENERNRESERSNHRQREDERNALAYEQNARNRARINHRQMEDMKNSLDYEDNERNREKSNHRHMDDLKNVPTFEESNSFISHHVTKPQPERPNLSRVRRRSQVGAEGHPSSFEAKLRHRQSNDRKKTPIRRSSRVHQREADEFEKSGPWCFPTEEPVQNDKYFDQVACKLKPFAQTQEASTDPQAEIIRAKLVGSCVDPLARDSDFDSIEFNGNAKLIKSPLVHFDTSDENDVLSDEGTDDCHP